MTGGFAEWAETYGWEPNALLALADRALIGRLGDLRGLRVLDAGCGTGRGLRKAAETGAKAVGVDAEPAMLRQAPRGELVRGALEALPFRAGSFDLALAVFSLSYAGDPAAALAEIAGLVRLGGRVIVADMHPDAVEAGWKRTFTSQGRTLEVPSRPLELDAALLDPPAGWRVAALDSVRFGDGERHFFTDDHWERVRRVWAVRLAVWRRAE